MDAYESTAHSYRGDHPVLIGATPSGTNGKRFAVCWTNVRTFVDGGDRTATADSRNEFPSETCIHRSASCRHIRVCCGLGLALAPSLSRGKKFTNILPLGTGAVSGCWASGVGLQFLPGQVTGQV